MLVYLLKSGACLAILLLFYKLVLERESMHHFKRFYLLGALVISLVIPTIVFTEYVEIVPSTIIEEAQITNAISGSIIQQDTSKEMLINWETVIWLVYGLGVFGFGFRFINHLAQIKFRIQKNPKLKDNFIIRVLLAQQLPPHTFFNYIFLNKKQFELQNIPEEVLLHEETHAKQRHSIDILLIELAQVFLWFNPLIYLLKSSIKLNHEFLADSAVVKNDTSIPQYQHLLLSFLSKASENHNSSINIANAIVYSSTRAERSRSIKKRFTVMKKNTSKKSVVFRSLLLLPVLALLLFGFTETHHIEKESTYDQIIKIELINNHTAIMGNEKFNFIEIPNEINYNYLQTINAINTKVIITAIQPVHFNSIYNLSEEIRKIGIFKIEVTANKLIMSKDQYKDNIPITEETILLNANTMTIIGNGSTKSVSQSEFAKYNTLAKKYNAIPINKRKIPLDDLKQLETIYKNMSATQKKDAVSFPECLPKKTQNQTTVTEILININSKGQLLVQEDLVAINDLKEYLSKINKHLSIDERQKVIRTVIRVDTHTPKDVIQKVNNVLIDYGTATIDIVGPKNSMKSSQQKSATREEMKEYNSLAKKYNEMDHDHMRIKMQDVQRLKEIYATMSSKQRADAAPFPDFPEPPLTPNAPKAPEAPNEREVGAVKIKEIIKEQDPYDVVSGGIRPKQSIMAEPPLPPTYIKEIRLDNPPKPPTPPNPLDHVINMAKKGATFMYKGKKISSDKAIELVKNNKELSISTKQTNNGTPLVKISKYL